MFFPLSLNPTKITKSLSNSSFNKLSLNESPLLFNTCNASFEILILLLFLFLIFINFLKGLLNVSKKFLTAYISFTVSSNIEDWLR